MYSTRHFLGVVTSYKLSFHTAAILGGWKILVPGKILEGGTTFRWVIYMKKLRSVWCPSREGIKNWERQNKSAVWALVLSLLAFKTTGFQQNCHINQLIVTTDEMVGLACLLPWLSNARPATIFAWFVPSRKIVLPLSQEDSSIRKIRLALMTSSTLKLSAF